MKVYAKLPGWFQVPTPLGGYNPDWAVLVQTEEGERLYFVVETKGSLFVDSLREQEAGKITCGKAHFDALRVRRESTLGIWKVEGGALTDVMDVGSKPLALAVRGRAIWVGCEDGTVRRYEHRP